MLGCQKVGNPTDFSSLIAGCGIARFSKIDMLTALNLAGHTPYLSGFISTIFSKHLQILSFFTLKLVNNEIPSILYRTLVEN